MAHDLILGQTPRNWATGQSIRKDVPIIGGWTWKDFLAVGILSAIFGPWSPIWPNKDRSNPDELNDGG
jgi:hypothetical protein